MWFEYDEGMEAKARRNRESLVALLRHTGESRVELYGVWEGEFDMPPLVREEIPLYAILNRDFRFKERRFYVVDVASASQTS
jgi:hypothetical protein